MARIHRLRRLDRSGPMVRKGRLGRVRPDYQMALSRRSHHLVQKVPGSKVPMARKVLRAQRARLRRLGLLLQKVQRGRLGRVHPGYLMALSLRSHRLVQKGQGSKVPMARKVQKAQRGRLRLPHLDCLLLQKVRKAR